MKRFIGIMSSFVPHQKSTNFKSFRRKTKKMKLLKCRSRNQDAPIRHTLLTVYTLLPGRIVIRGMVGVGIVPIRRG